MSTSSAHPERHDPEMPAGAHLPGGALLIGWKESVAMPDWGIKRLLAKSDTGACHSAIDAENITDLGDGTLRFDVMLSRKDRSKRKTVVAPVSRQARVRSSLGDRHHRYVVETTLRIGDVEQTIEVGLVDRSGMRCRMLLGRSSLAPMFLVDSSRSFLHGPPPSRASKIKKRKATSVDPSSGGSSPQGSSPQGSS